MLVACIQLIILRFPIQKVQIVPLTVRLESSMLANLLFLDPKRTWNIFQLASDHEED